MICALISTPPTILIIYLFKMSKRNLPQHHENLYRERRARKYTVPFWDDWVDNKLRESMELEHHLIAKGYPRLEVNEPRHDKTNKMSVRSTKSQISLGFRPVWPESSLSAWRSWDRDWADAQADLSLRWAQSHFVSFVMSRLKLYGVKYPVK